MNRIDKDELFGHVSEFLKAKGVELQDGTYTRTIHKGCQVLADTINLSQQAMERTKAEIEKKLEQARQVIHEKTAPRKPPVTPRPGRSSGSSVPPRASAKPRSKQAEIIEVRRRAKKRPS